VEALSDRNLCDLFIKSVEREIRMSENKQLKDKLNFRDERLESLGKKLEYVLLFIYLFILFIYVFICLFYVLFIYGFSYLFISLFSYLV
jgi:hypothetical protein